jgi:hypothetical protein
MHGENAVETRPLPATYEQLLVIEGLQVGLGQ